MFGVFIIFYFFLFFKLFLCFIFYLTFVVECVIMIKSHRKSVHKGKAARHFQGSSSKVHKHNVRLRPMRGGFRL